MVERLTQTSEALVGTWGVMWVVVGVEAEAAGLLMAGAVVAGAAMLAGAVVGAVMVDGAVAGAAMLDGEAAIAPAAAGPIHVFTPPCLRQARASVCAWL